PAAAGGDGRPDRGPGPAGRGRPASPGALRGASEPRYSDGSQRRRDSSFGHTAAARRIAAQTPSGISGQNGSSAPPMMLVAPQMLLMMIAPPNHHRHSSTHSFHAEEAAGT